MTFQGEILGQSSGQEGYIIDKKYDLTSYLQIIEMQTDPAGLK